MHRDVLLKLLSDYTSNFDEEKEYTERIVKFIKNNDNCFDRCCEIGHITASAWLVNQDNTKVLLMLHKKLDLWLQLGGHCDGDSDVLRVALKEAQEESGIKDIFVKYESIFDLDVHMIPEIKNVKSHIHYDIRFLLQTKHDIIIKNEESKNLQWILKNKNDSPSKERSIMRMFDKWIKYY